MKRIGWIVVVLSLSALISITAAWAGEKEELQLRLGALAQEERAITAEQLIYQNKFQENQDRLPEIKKERAEIQEKLKAVDVKEKAEKAALKEEKK
jgi:predicted nuclease with TOPRIM domain